MKLQDYLKAIGECPDEEVEINIVNQGTRKCNQLTAEFGVYDNWPILLKAGLEKVVQDLESAEKYKFKGPYNKGYEFYYIPGTVNLQVLQITEDHLTKYKTSILLHHYQDKKIPGISWEKAIALVIEDLGQLIIQENIPTCMPRSVGWKYCEPCHFFAYDNPKGVYFPDEDEIKMFPDEDEIKMFGGNKHE